jgi:hypothetical protein
MASRKRRAFLLAVLTEMAFAETGLFFGIGQGHGRNPVTLRWLLSNHVSPACKCVMACRKVCGAIGFAAV